MSRSSFESNESNQPNQANQSRQPDQSRQSRQTQSSQSSQRSAQKGQSQMRLIIFLSAGFLVLLLGLGGVLFIFGGSDQNEANGTSTVSFVPVEQAPVTQPAAVPDSTAGPANGPTLRLVQVEDQAVFEIWIEDVSGFYALDLEIRFDPQALQIIDADPDTEGVQIEPGQVPAPDFVATNSVDQQQGSIHYVVTQLAPRIGFSGSGLVGRFAWQGTVDQEDAITFERVTLVNDKGEPIEATLQSLADQQRTLSLVQK